MPKHCWTLAATALLLCAGSSGLSAASPPHYNMDLWTTETEDRLPQNSVIALRQTQDGYLWLGTRNGLARFDGVHFSVFDESNTPGLNSASIVKLFEDSHGNLWMGTETAGVVMVDKSGKLTSLSIGRPGREGRLMAITEDASGTVWLYTADGTLGRYRERLDTWTDDTPSNCRALAAEDSGLVWVGTDTKLTAYGPFAAGVTVGLPVAHETSGAELGRLDLLVASERGGYWRFANGHIQKYRARNLEHDFGPYPWTNASVSAACEDREGNLVVGTLGEGVFWFDADGKFTQFFLKTADRGFSEKLVLSLCVDREGCLWVGTDGGGLDRVKRQVFEVLEDTRARPVQSVCEDSQKGLWFGITYGINAGGVGYLKDGVVRQINTTQGAANLYVRSVLVDRNGKVWVGTDKGLFQFLDGQFLRTREADTVSALFQDRQGVLWVGTQAGLARWDEHTWRVYTMRDGLSANAVQAIADDGWGNLWVGTAGGGLNRLSGGRFSYFGKTNGLPSNNVLSLYVDETGLLWVGTSSGLARFHGGEWTRYSKQNGLISNNVGYLLEDGQGYLWLGSDVGLMRVRKQELNDVANHRTKTVSVRAYGKPDGLPTGECTFGYQPGSLRAKDGKLWFTTSQGLVSVNPLQLVPNTNPPPVVIESVWIDRQLQTTNTLRAPGPKAITVPAGSEALAIDYTSLNLSAPEKTSFRYRLEGHETAWTPAGSYNRVAHYSRLPPNDYVFQVQACNEDGTWNRVGSMVAIKVLPPFWRTWWFLTLSTGFLLGMIVGSVHYVSTQRLQRQLESLRHREALEKERARIARDIHDQVGASLTQVSLLSEMVESDKDDPKEVEAHARQLSQTALETTRALDQIVWTVNPSNDTLDGLITYTCKYAQDYLAVAGLRYRLEVPEQLPSTPISPELRHNVFLAAKEAVTNVVRHARASAAWLRLRLEADRFTLEIEDNGRGMAALDEKKGRNGLRNMRKRMEDIGGEFSIGPGSQGGAVVRLVAPLKSIGSESENSV